MFPSSRHITLALAAGGVPLLLAAVCTTSCSRTPSLPVLLKSTPAYPVAETLDAIIQPRFQDDRLGVFGVSRVIVPGESAVSGHPVVGVFTAANPREAPLFAQINADKRPYVVAFLHCAHVPGKYAGSQGGYIENQNGDPTPYLRFLTAGLSSAVPHPQAQAVPSGGVTTTPLPLMDSASYVAVNKAAIDALPTLQRGEGAEATAGDWLVVMRPVCVSKNSCLTCHTGAKQGDTLGVMVYAVNNSADKT